MLILIPKWVTSACISVNGLPASGLLPIFRFLNSSGFSQQVGIAGNNIFFSQGKVAVHIRSLCVNWTTSKRTQHTVLTRRAMLWNALFKRQDQGTAFTLKGNDFTKAL
jgi:hypothetical protein